MATLLNPMARRLAVASCGRLLTPAAAEPPRISPEHPRYSSSTVGVNGGLDEMLASTRRFYVPGGKGGVGKTSMAAALAVKFASRGEQTLLVSMDPTSSLGDALEQDMSDGEIVCINGFDSLFASEFEEFNMDELLRIPPGLEEAFAIIQLIKDVEMQGRLRHIVLDTASTGANAASFLPAIKSSLEAKIDSDRVEKISQQFARMRDLVNDPLVEEIRRLVNRACELLYDPQSTEFIIVTIPTMMAVSESSRFHTSLKKDGAHTRRLIVNQVLPPSASDCRFCAAKRREQARAFDAIREDRELGGLKLIQAPLLDVEVKGVAALRFLSETV